MRRVCRVTLSELEVAYLDIVKNPRIYEDNLFQSASVILRHCAHTLGVTRSSMWLLSEDQSGMDCLALYDVATDEFEEGAALSQALFPRYFEALFNGRVIDAVDTFTDPRTSELTESYLEVLDVRSLLDATIRNANDGQLQGVVCVEMVGAQRDWTADEKMFVASIADLLSQRLVTTELARSAKAYQALFEHTSDGILIYAKDKYVDCNPAAERLFGVPENGMRGLQSTVDLSPEYQPDGQLSATKGEAYIQACFDGTPQLFEWRHRRPDGSEFDAEVTLSHQLVAGESIRFALVRDITFRKEAERQAKIAQSKLEYRAAHDSLTGLLNREQLHLHIEKLIGEVQSPSHQIALLLFDLNRFKEINDTLGHATGDKVLIGLAELLNDQTVALDGSLFRLGGDEFVAAFQADSDRELADLIVFLEQCLKSPVEVEGVSFEMSASIGAAVFPDDGQDSHELLRCADVAMYHCKSSEGASPWYSVENDVYDRRRLAMVTELRQAIRDDELVLHFQPRIHIKSGDITGCEALVRWQHPLHGLLPPIEFLPLAEMTELIHPLSAWVVDSAFDQIKRLQALGHQVPVAINLSARNLPDSQLFDQIEARLNEEGLYPRLLEVEITESALMNDPKRSLQNLQRLEALGVSIAIDDFGTGYSSMGLLKQLPLDTIKIDRSFVDEMLSSGPDNVIVQSTVSLAHNFSCKAVAEGVENQETLDALAAQNCDEAQGYFIARPMSVEAFESWLSERPLPLRDPRMAQAPDNPAEIPAQSAD